VIRLTTAEELTMDKDTPPSRRRRWLLRAGIGAVAVAALAAAGLRARGVIGPAGVEASSSPAPAGKDDKAKEKEPAAVAVHAAELGPISAYTAATANLVAEDEVKVVAETDGKVLRVLVEEGDGVARGQTLVQIDPADATLAVEKAQIALQNAGISLTRGEGLSKANLISAQELDKLRFERDLAAHELADSRHRLRKTTVAAPFGGRITIRKIQTGQQVKPGDELFTLADFDPLVARIFLPEREVLDLAVGQSVRLALRAREETRFSGRIRQISPVVDTASGTVKVTVEAVRPPASVRPGAFVTVEVLRETRANAVLVPRPAVIRELQETYVFVAEGKVARKRVVDVGLEEGDRLEIRSGLKAGEQVITAGQGALKDQAPISVAPPKAGSPS
jgi:membrane fusion protein (multidrug efflux system)